MKKVSFILLLMLIIPNVVFAVTKEECYSYENNPFSYSGMCMVYKDREPTEYQQKVCNNKYIYCTETGTGPICDGNAEMQSSPRPEMAEIYFKCQQITSEEPSVPSTPDGPSELPEIKHCNSLLGNPKCNGKSEDPECLNKNATPAYYMSIVFRLMRWAAIILLIVMSILEFTGATASGDEDQLQKVIKRTGIRLGLCVLIFLLPYLIDYLLSLLDQAGISDCVNIN